MIDHVEVDLRAVLLAVRDQGARPTCLAHATTTAHEHIRRAPAHLSPEYLRFFANPRSSTGITVDEVSRALMSEGQSEEIDCPYLPQDPPFDWKPPADLTVFRRASESRVANPVTVDSWIRDGRVPVLGISLPESFYNPALPWVISPDGTVRALHAVAAVGLGQHQGGRVFLIRNSWGADWGDGGYAWFSDTFLERHLKETLLLTEEIIS